VGEVNKKKTISYNEEFAVTPLRDAANSNFLKRTWEYYS